MSLSYFVQGIRPKDELYDRMRAALLACEAVGAPVPDCVTNYFMGQGVDTDPPPDPAGVVVYVGSACGGPIWGDGVSRYESEHYSGLEIDLRELDPTIKILRVLVG